MRPLILLLVVLASGCSKYEFDNPTGAKATVVYDKTGTADQVTKEIAQTKPAAK